MGGKGGDAPTLNTMDMIRMGITQRDLASDLMKQQTQQNRPNQVTPWGSTVWEDLGNNQWRQSIELPENMRRTLEAQQGIGAERSELAQDLMGQATEELGAPLNWEALDTNPVLASEEGRQRAEDALYSRATSRLDPYWEQRRSAMETQLFNQGLRPGDEAYNTAMGNLERAQTDAYQAARDQAIAGGGAEMERSFGMDLSRRQQAIAELLRRRGVALGDVNALTQGQNVTSPDMPGFQAAGRVATPDLMGAQQAGYQADLNKYSAKQAQDQALWSGIGSVAGATIPFFMSDRRLKSDIMHIGHTLGGQRVYEYTIFGRREIGVMAQESPPDSVAIHPSGYLMVDYSRIR